LIVPLALLATLLQAQQLGKGTVRSSTGATLDRVWVQELGSWNGSPTKADGGFAFPLGKPATLLLARDGFRPEILLTTGIETDGEIRVVMRREPDALSLGSCKQQESGPLPELELAKTVNVQVKRGGDVDFVGYTATYTKNGEAAATLGSMTGLHIGGLTPTPDWVRGLSSFTVRSIKCGEVHWIDLRGVSEGACNPGGSVTGRVMSSTRRSQRTPPALSTAQSMAAAAARKA
jgi:hypothetical protein